MSISSEEDIQSPEKPLEKQLSENDLWKKMEEVFAKQKGVSLDSQRLVRAYNLPKSTDEHPDKPRAYSLTLEDDKKLGITRLLTIYLDKETRDRCANPSLTKDPNFNPNSLTEIGQITMPPNQRAVYSYRQASSDEIRQAINKLG